MDSWSEVQLRKMEAGGNAALNEFLAAYGVPKETDIAIKYNSAPAEAYRAKIQAAADGRAWTPPAIEKVNLSAAASGRPPAGGASRSAARASPGGFGSSDGWDDWGDGGRTKGYGTPQTATNGRGTANSGNFRRHQSDNSISSWESGTGGSARGAHGGGGGGGSSSRSGGGGQYTQAELEASAASKDSFFARKQAENASRPEGLPPSQGGKYVGFGSGPSRPPPKDDVLDTVSQVRVCAPSEGFVTLVVLHCFRCG